MNEQLLRELAAKLGTTAEHLWSVLVYQARIEAIQNIAFIVFTAILTWLTVRYWKWAAEADVNNEEAVFIGGAFGTLVVAILVLIAVICFFSLPTLLFNPEYWALGQVLDAIKPKK